MLNRDATKHLLHTVIYIPVYKRLTVPQFFHDFAYSPPFQNPQGVQTTGMLHTEEDSKSS